MRVPTIASRAGALIAIFTLGVLPASCTNDKSLTGQTASTGTFIQVARIGRPLVIELYTPWADHDFILRSTPGADASSTGKLYTDIGTFVSTFADRSPAITSFLQNLFAGQAPVPPSRFPTEANVLVADLAVQGPATFLGIESDGQITSTGAFHPHKQASFGGRGLPDDVAAIILGLTFGSLVPQISGIPDDGREKNGLNGTPDLANDNVTSLTPPAKHYQIGYPYAPLAFPFLGKPI
jgi:hypothetical protein